MSAIGELFVIIMYAILSIPICIMIGLFIAKRKNYMAKHFIYLIVSFIPILLFTFYQYNSHRQEELLKVGTYYLTNYPECKTCIIKLKDDNTYSVINNTNEIETGEWNYRSGGDYWIVDLGDYGQLGSGKFKYTNYKNGYSKE